jgi:hypothetical protein
LILQCDNKNIKTPAPNINIYGDFNVISQTSSNKSKITMRLPVWIKPTIIGGAVGAIALAITGFNIAGWVSEGTAQDQATDHARNEVTAALLPICLSQAQQDPRFAATMAKLKDARSFDRSKMLQDAGWATMSGSTEPHSRVSFACMDKLSAQF